MNNYEQADVVMLSLDILSVVVIAIFIVLLNNKAIKKTPLLIAILDKEESYPSYTIALNSNCSFVYNGLIIFLIPCPAFGSFEIAIS